MSDILEILARGDGGLASLLKSVLLDSEGKVPADRLRIVGALASGAVIEHGSNANGEYVKFADGTMICTFNSGILGYSYVAERVITFPCAFVSRPAVIPAMFLDHSDLDSIKAGGVIFGAKYNTSKSSCTVGAVTIGTSGKLYNAELDMCAIGRWK